MKFKHRCEFDGCNKEGNHKGFGNHWLCDRHFRIMKHNHKVFGHNAFFKEIHIGNIGGYALCAEKLVKFYK